MITIISALKSEISPLFHKVQIAEKIKLGSASLYLSEKIHFLRTGIGPEKAKQSTEAYLNQFKPVKILNTGLAGKLNPDFQIGSIYHVTKIFFKDMKPISLNADQNSRTASLLTVEKPVTDLFLRNKLYKKYKAELADMEAYAAASAAASKGIPFSSIKIISDNADNNTSLTFLKNYKKLAGILAEYIWNKELKSYLF